MAKERAARAEYNKKCMKRAMEKIQSDPNKEGWLEEIRHDAVRSMGKIERAENEAASALKFKRFSG